MPTSSRPLRPTVTSSASRIQRLACTALLALVAVSAQPRSSHAQAEIASNAQIPKQPCFPPKDFYIVQNGLYFNSFFTRVTRHLEAPAQNPGNARWGFHDDENTFSRAQTFNNIWSWNLQTPIALTPRHGWDADHIWAP